MSAALRPTILTLGIPPEIARELQSVLGSRFHFAFQKTGTPPQATTASAILVYSENPETFLNEKPELPCLPILLLCPDLDMDTITALTGAAHIHYVLPWPCDYEDLAERLYASHFRLAKVPATMSGPEPATGILLVDDEVTATRYLSRQLQQREPAWHIECAADANVARQKIENAPHHYAVVMCDHRMPGTSGQHLLEELSERFPLVVRLLTSAYGELDVALQAFNQSHIFRYIQKPWQTGVVHGVLSDALVEHQRLRKDSEERKTHYLVAADKLARHRRLRVNQALSDAGNAQAIESIKRLMEDLRSIPVTVSPRSATIARDILFREEQSDPVIETFIERLLPILRRVQAIPLMDIEMRTRQIKTVSSSGLIARAWATLLQKSALTPDDLCFDLDLTANRWRLGLKPEQAFRLLHPLFTDTPSLTDSPSSEGGIEVPLAMATIYLAYHRLGAGITFTPCRNGFRLAVTNPPQETP